MGYYTSLSGEFTIDPPLSWVEIRGQRLTEFWEDYGPFRVIVSETTEDTDEGVRIIKRGVEVEPCTDHSIKAYKIEEDLQRLVDALPHHRLVGTVIGDGEDAGDYWRLFVGSDRRVVKETARLIWPDGTPVEGV